MEENKIRALKEIKVISGLISILYGVITSVGIMLFFHPLISILCFVVLFIQWVLCLKVRSLIVKLLPIIITLIAGIVFIYISSVTLGYGALAYMGIGILAGFMIFSCVVVWCICIIVKRVKLKKAEGEMQ